jgi:hypothetical protein
VKAPHNAASPDLLSLHLSFIKNFTHLRILNTIVGITDYKICKKAVEAYRVVRC